MSWHRETTTESYTHTQKDSRTVKGTGVELDCKGRNVFKNGMMLKAALMVMKMRKE